MTAQFASAWAGLLAMGPFSSLFVGTLLRDAVLARARQSVERLGHVDLLLVHAVGDLLGPDGDALRVNDSKIALFKERDPCKIPWGAHGVDIDPRAVQIAAQRGKDCPGDTFPGLHFGHPGKAGLGFIHELLDCAQGPPLSRFTALGAGSTRFYSATSTRRSTPTGVTRSAAAVPMS